MLAKAKKTVKRVAKRVARSRKPSGFVENYLEQKGRPMEWYAEQVELAKKVHA